VLSTDELRDLWRYLDGDSPIALSRGATPESRITMPAETGETLRHLFKCLLLAGQRLGETSNMKWTDVDLDAKRWTISATETKNRTAHQVPLSEPAVELLTARQDMAHPLATYVFPSSPKRHMSSVKVWSYRTAAALARATRIAFTAHDLRRTVATMMGELGIDGDTIGLVLNHRKPGVTTRHYDHSTRETAKRAALDRWAQRLTQIVTETPAKVTPIRART
jgi:integrase